jgi:CheY-like chemotaxis protein
LAISREFVQMMGGDLTVTSELGKGSCFGFEVRVQPTESLASEEKAAPRRVIGLQAEARPVRVLVVDDEPTNRTLLCELLGPIGFEVAEAANGLEALEVFARWSPHAVLMDMRMPQMDGYEATRRIKATEAGRATPVIAITASAFMDEERKVREVGTDGYVRKPLRAAELFQALEQCLGLRYIYAEEEAALRVESMSAGLMPEAIVTLPEGLIEAMRQALEEGDMTRLRELIGQVEELDSAAARTLQELADRYDYEKLGEILGKGAA